MKTLFSQSLTLGEGPRCCDDGLWWVDIIAGTVFHCPWPPASAKVQSWNLLQQVGMIGALAPAQAGGLVIAAQQGWHHFDPLSGVCTLIAQPIPDPEIRFNDAAIDPAGRMLSGTMPLSMPAGQGQLWSLETDGSYQLRLENLSCPNGMAWSDDGSILYLIDSPQRAIQLFAYDVTTGIIGAEQGRIDLSAIPGVPDGCCRDVAGNLWVAFWGGSCVCCYDLTSGACREQIACPTSQITACALSGSGELFITSAGLGIDEAEGGHCFIHNTHAQGIISPPWQGQLA